MQQKTGLPVHFEITEPIRNSLYPWIASTNIKSEDLYFQTVFMIHPIYLRDNMQESLMHGWKRLGWIQLTMVLTPCEE